MSSTYSMTMAIPDLFREADIEITFEFEVISWGSSASWCDPGSLIEWEITDIFIEDIHIPYQPKASPLYSALWQSLAEAGTTYIDEHFDWGRASNDAAEDYYED